MITNLYPICGLRDLRARQDADSLLEKWWRKGVERRISSKAHRHAPIRMPFKVVK